MDPNDLVIADVRGYLSMDKSDTTFDNEILPIINSAVGKVYQNGACKSIIIDATTKWSDLTIDGSMSPDYYTMIPLYFMQSTKLMFDPPPPSMVDYYRNNQNDLLWRLKIAVELNEVTTNG